MRTSDPEDAITPLPPPPAPTARDANPWPVTGVPGPARRTVLRRPRQRDPGQRKAREGLRNLLMLGVVAFILVSALMEALRGGGVGPLVGALFPLLILAVLFLARRRKSRNGGAGRTGQSDAG